MLPEPLDLKPVDRKDLTWIPNHPHVGPGNPIYPWAKNEVDAIARTHDIEYGAARSVWDVYKADQKFLDRMNAIKPETRSQWWAKQIGSLGIKAKYSFERRFGVAYPTFTEEQLKEMRLNPEFQKLEKYWQRNVETLHYQLKEQLLGVDKFLTKGNINFQNVKQGLQNNALYRKIAPMNFSTYGMAPMNNAYNEAMNRGKVFAEESGDAQDKANDYYVEWLNREFTDFHHKIMLPKIHQYLKWRSDDSRNVSFRDTVYNLKGVLRDHLYERMQLSPSRKYKSQYHNHLKHTAYLDDQIEKYINAYQDKLNLQVMEYDDINFQNNVNIQQENYLQELNNLREKYGEEQTKVQLNRILAEVGTVQSEFAKLNNLYNQYKQAKTKYLDYHTTYLENQTSSVSQATDNEGMRIRRGLNDGK